MVGPAAGHPARVVHDRGLHLQRLGKRDDRRRHPPRCAGRGHRRPALLRSPGHAARRGHGRARGRDDRAAAGGRVRPRRDGRGHDHRDRRRRRGPDPLCDQRRGGVRGLRGPPARDLSGQRDVRVRDPGRDRGPGRLGPRLRAGRRRQRRRGAPGARHGRERRDATGDACHRGLRPRRGGERDGQLRGPGRALRPRPRRAVLPPRRYRHVQSLHRRRPRQPAGTVPPGRQRHREHCVRQHQDGRRRHVRVLQRRRGPGWQPRARAAGRRGARRRRPVAVLRGRHAVGRDLHADLDRRRRCDLRGPQPAHRGDDGHGGRAPRVPQRRAARWRGADAPRDRPDEGVRSRRHGLVALHRRRQQHRRGRVRLPRRRPRRQRLHGSDAG